MCAVPIFASIILRGKTHGNCDWYKKCATSIKRVGNSMGIFVTIGKNSIFMNDVNGNTTIERVFNYDTVNKKCHLKQM